MAAVCSVQLRRAAGEAERARVREQAEEAKARRARLRRERREEAERQAQMRQLRQRAWPFLRARMAVARVKGQRDWEGLRRAHAERQQAQREVARGAPRQRATASTLRHLSQRSAKMRVSTRGTCNRLLRSNDYLHRSDTAGTYSCTLIQL